MQQKNAQTRAFLLDFLKDLGLIGTSIKITSVSIIGNGPKPAGRWHFNVIIGEGDNSLNFAVQLRPSCAKYMRVLACRPSSFAIPQELEEKLNAFEKEMRDAKYKLKETTATQFRRIIEMNMPTSEIEPEIENDLKKQIIWIFQNPAVAATVKDQKTRWFYNNPNTGIFFITQIPG